MEAVSSFNRLHRENNLTHESKQQALARLSYLRQKWSEIQPTDEVRNTAERLLNVHKLSTTPFLQEERALICLMLRAIALALRVLDAARYRACASRA